MKQEKIIRIVRKQYVSGQMDRQNDNARVKFHSHVISVQRIANVGESRQNILYPATHLQSVIYSWKQTWEGQIVILQRLESY